MKKIYIAPATSTLTAGTRTDLLQTQTISQSVGDITEHMLGKEREFVDDTPSNSDFGTDNLWGDLQD